MASLKVGGSLSRGISCWWLRRFLVVVLIRLEPVVAGLPQQWDSVAYESLDRRRVSSQSSRRTRLSSELPMSRRRVGIHGSKEALLHRSCLWMHWFSQRPINSQLWGESVDDEGAYLITSPSPECQWCLKELLYDTTHSRNSPQFRGQNVDWIQQTLVV